MLQAQGLVLNINHAAIEWLSDAGYDPQFGARPVKRVVQKHILNELSKRILSGNIRADQPIMIDYANGRLVFEN
jgi:ATP-dependent Clp protease ATP-binding subunit ClpB